MALYVGRLFLVRSFSILFALVLILQTLDLLGESGKILGVAGNSDSDVWRYVGMRLPQIVETFLPFLLFAALAVWMYYTLAHVPGGQPIGALERAASKIGQRIRGLIRIFRLEPRTT